VAGGGGEDAKLELIREIRRDGRKYAAHTGEAQGGRSAILRRSRNPKAQRRMGEKGR
jgi:hypothetical protein